MLEPGVSTAGREYVEWVIEEAGVGCSIMLGVTALDALPQGGGYLHDSPSSSMYSCSTSRAFPGGRGWGASGLRAAGDRVGLLVQGGRLSVLVNGERLGPGPMAGDLPPHVRFCAELRGGARVRVVAGAAAPPGL